MMNLTTKDDVRSIDAMESQENQVSIIEIPRVPRYSISTNLHVTVHVPCVL